MLSYHHVNDGSGDGLRTAWIRSATVRFLPVVFFWWVLTGGDPASLTIGIPTVLLATIVSLWLSPPAPRVWRPNSLWRFVLFVHLFACYSLKGGVDVARRALSPGMPLAPAMLDYSLQLRDGTARVFFANIVSLLPGTLSSDIRGNTLVVHVLDRSLPVFPQLQRLEVAVAKVFGSPIGS
ncbi:MAG: Na+/H+ antiporter subunit E [Planctomycetota bacterium]|nr:Na+/H+ antiporter subunit E [Planctomycetota bacterium]